MNDKTPPQKPQFNFKPIDTYSLAPAKRNSDIKALTKNGMFCKCHKVQQYPFQNQFNSIEFQPELCSTLCSRFQLGVLEDAEGKEQFFVVRQTCETIPMQFTLSGVKIEQKDLAPVNKPADENSLIVD